MQAHCALRELLFTLLEQERLCVADVGGAGGPEPQWKGWENLCFFYTFDPDPRAQPWSTPSQNFPIGLWSQKSTQPIHLTAYPPASSLFKADSEVVETFQLNHLFKEIGTRNVKLDTVDKVLAEHRVDFLKIDAEGAELEILKGATRVLTQQCLGLQVEALFSPLRRNAPLFSELDTYVRYFDFELFQLQREHWIRKNRISTYDSTPQLIWGNVLYLLPKKLFLKRLKESATPEKLFAKYILILLAYKLYDYAYELCEAFSSPHSEKIKELLCSLPQSKKALLPLFLSLLTGSTKYLLSFSPSSKADRRHYLKRKLRELGKTCLYLAKNDFALYD